MQKASVAKDAKIEGLQKRLDVEQNEIRELRAMIEGMKK